MNAGENVRFACRARFPAGCLRLIISKTSTAIICALLIFGLHDASAIAAAPLITLRAGSLENALTELARQAGWQLLLDPEIVRGLNVTAGQKNRSAHALLRQLLMRHQLEVRWLSRNALMITRSPIASRRPATTPDDSAPEIVVTALKRPTIISDTPVSMTVELGQTMISLGMRDIRTVARGHPELTVLDSAVGQQRLAIRGIVGSGEPTVGVYYDETAIAGPGGTTFDPGAISPDLDLVDVDRMEILRGPQGTLYGASAMGGVIKMLFNRPDPTAWHGEARAGVEQSSGAGPGRSASLIFNAPLVHDRLAARFSIYNRHIGGRIRNPHLNLTDLGQVEKTGGRIAIEWSPTAGAKITASAIYQHTKVSDTNFWYRDQGYYINNQSTRTPQRNRLGVYNLKFEYNLGDISATLSASRYDWHIVRLMDYTTILNAQKIDPIACRNYFLLIGESQCSESQIRDFAAFIDTRLPGLVYQPMSLGSESGELRISSDAANWTAGIYLERRREHIYSYAVLAEAKNGSLIQPLDITGLRTLRSSLTQQAVFGEWTRPLDSAWALTLGGRLFRYQRRASAKVNIPNPITGTAALQEGSYETSESGSNLKLLLSYRPAKTILLYGQISQGFRPGGVNIAPSLTNDIQTYGADRLIDLELGMKLRTPGNRMALNIDVYRIYWLNMITPFATSNGAFGYNSNVGGAISQGAEAEVSYAIRSRTTIQGRVSFIDARLTQDSPIGFNGAIAKKGDRLPNTPNIAVHASLQHRRPLSTNLSVMSRLELGFVGGMTSAFNRTDRYFERTPSRFFLDWLFSVDHGRWNVGLSVRNILKDRTPARILSSTAGTGQIYGSAPRTIGLEFRHII
ncbi:MULTISPECIES: TonB-dependent receptor [unclassified Sphingomonas]|uniref:TonB-dependent receptor n=1 Tax=unclassified Sphingomonas TaxID=196159 RepID=UPI0006FB62A0|nr:MULTISPECIES: TonB-dependent receptor [unclassified Sphingomonas]KQX19606.1 hypothetical protein ASD17_13955 [Sphingomonas sp. Root1294]KQY65807.1 hypothetical protein ASD39_17155 [Sphingomonas sp. Root50]KRB94887.1 hypothetical protein ASE22_02900 [Sphingomonas sp. Root720]